MHHPFLACILDRPSSSESSARTISPLCPRVTRPLDKLRACLLEPLGTLHCGPSTRSAPCSRSPTLPPTVLPCLTGHSIRSSGCIHRPPNRYGIVPEPCTSANPARLAQRLVDARRLCLALARHAVDRSAKISSLLLWHLCCPSPFLVPGRVCPAPTDAADAADATDATWTPTWPAAWHAPRATRGGSQ